ncbi:MAG: hypothetical protein IKC12_06400 [Alistipes sp.]|nr:hypothetical protein [Alistipes sp.]
MKRSGRNIKQRLYGLKHIGGYVRRARYFRGHGVHSPYVYDVVRQVFMRRDLMAGEHPVYDSLVALDVPRRRAVQIDNLAKHCGYERCVVDRLEHADMIVATLATSPESLGEYYRYAREIGATLCIMAPYNNANRWRVVKSLIDDHPSTTVDNRGYLLVFNNHLPKQRFRL